MPNYYSQVGAQVIIACWIVFGAVWLVAALKGGAGSRSYSPAARALRLLLLATFLLLMRYGDQIPRPSFGRFTVALSVAGAALCVAGVAFAVWARVTIGRNWGMPMSHHERPELVTSGPYRYVRHPIYTGVGAMLIGTALDTPLGAIPAVILIAYFVFAALREERDMAQRFPDAYPAYRQRSKMLVPFVL